MNMSSSMPAIFRGNHREISIQAERKHIQKALAANNFFGLDFSAPWLQKVLNAYQQPHRFFHNLEHLRGICESIVAQNRDDQELCAKLLLTALFHDSVWFPQRSDNEKQSADAFEMIAPSFGAQLPPQVFQEIKDAIIATKNLGKDSELAAKFHPYDCAILLHGSTVDLLAYEFQIFREFQHLNVTNYRKGRSAFFTRFSKKYPEARESMKFLVEYLERRRPRVGIYAGSFNPFHIGHLLILEKAEAIFDKIIVAVGLNPDKKIQRCCNVEDVLPFHEVIYYKSLIVDLIERESAMSDVTLIRGLRNSYDLDYEMNQLSFIKDFCPDIRAIHITCDKELEHISSSALAGLKHFDLKGRDASYYPTKYEYFNYPLEKLF